MVLPFESMILQDGLIAAAFFVLSYFALGALVKFIDDAFDEHVYSQPLAFVLSPLTAIFWAYVMALHPVSAMILTAIIIGVLVKGKIDNLAFVIAVLCVYLVFFFIGSFDFVMALALPLIVITVAGMVDEIGNDWVDKNNIYHKKPFGRYVHLFFEYRCIMKLAVLGFALFGFIPMMFFVAFLAWDIGYEIVMNASKYIQHKRKFYYHKTA